MPVFGVVDPFAQVLSLFAGAELGALVGNVGIDIPVQQDRPAFAEHLPDLRGRIPAVFRKKQGDELRMDAPDRAETAAQELADQSAIDRCVIAGEMDVFQSGADTSEVFSEQSDLGGFAGSVQALQYD